MDDMKGPHMAHSRTNDPANLPMKPRLARSPERENQIVAEFKNRLTFLRGSYEFGRQALADDHAHFNESLARLRRRVRTIHQAKGRGERIHPEIESVITIHARRLAAADGGKVEQRHANEAARLAVGMLRAKRGRPDDRVLDHCVRGLMALIQETTGTPVLARRDRNRHYDPHFAPDVSQVVPRFFQDIDPSITTTRLVNIVRRARKEYAGRPMRFLDLFPFYGATLIDGEPKLRPGLRLERFELNIPIYCP